MTAAPPAAERGIPRFRLVAGQPVELDVEYCDLVPANTPGDEPAVRFKGRRLVNGRPGEQIRVFVDATMAELPMQKSGVLQGDLPALERGERAQPIKLALTHRRLTIELCEPRRHLIYYVIAPREGTSTHSDEVLVADYRWAMGQARNAIAPLFEQDRVAYGAAELLTIAGQLFQARRADRRRRE